MENPINPENLLLGAVNILLECINEIPIETEEDYDNIIEARQAKANIIEAKRGILAEGWDFNSDTNWTFAVGVGGMIPVPSNVLDLTASRHDVIVRNWRLYSKSDQSHIFTEPQDCDVVWDMDFNSISHPLRHYITLVAANLFIQRVTGNKEAVAYNTKDIQDAFVSARRSEGRTGGYNMLTGSYGVTNRVRIS